MKKLKQLKQIPETNTRGSVNQQLTNNTTISQVPFHIFIGSPGLMAQLCLQSLLKGQEGQGPYKIQRTNGLKGRCHGRKKPCPASYQMKSLHRKDPHMSFPLDLMGEVVPQITFPCHVGLYTLN